MKLMVIMAVLFLGLSISCPAVMAGPAADGVAAKQPGGVDEAELQKLQSRMMGDPQIMALISALQNDPGMRTLLSDPSFIQAINSRDIARLTGDPRFVSLFSNPAVQDIINRVGR